MVGSLPFRMVNFRVVGVEGVSIAGRDLSTTTPDAAINTQADPLVLDIGANIGLHTMWFSSHGYRTHR